MEHIKILTLSGSTREGSFNTKLAKLCTKIIESHKIDATFINLKQFPLPLYDGDYEANEPYPANAAKLKQLFLEHDGFLIASPEYNSSISGVLKNTIDWLSRSEQKGTDLSAFSEKVVSLVSASPGGLGGLRGLNQLRSILSNIGVVVLPNQLAIAQAHEAFDEKGNLKDPKKQQQLENVVEALIQTTKRFKINIDDYCKELIKKYCTEQMGAH
jgi:chromate reductase